VIIIPFYGSRLRKSRAIRVPSDFPNRGHLDGECYVTRCANWVDGCPQDWMREKVLLLRASADVPSLSALPHLVASHSSMWQSARSGAERRLLARRGWSRVFRVTNFSVTRSLVETLYYSSAARRLRNRHRRDATSSDSTCESVPRSRDTTIGSNRFRQSATTRNYLFKCADLSTFFFTLFVLHRRLRDIGYLL